ncbi:DUF6090 family protein [Croceivirga thetidis]|uniref:Uncharacterized protein n=1 Tax=Croceivirga thetidis TaxID=2721623 RepID=A0ABX1GMR2_9FLAO|nr:DUF6090 family protein [Croceivirga thetidis]NKI30933.1 hypothetical protein [Croceivirga thetidis]
MIKFFRRIRQKLLSENKFSKYILYAIAEIILVVIGILIALQINNWNEERKRAALEEKILLEIKDDLKFNIEKAKKEIEIEQTVITSINLLSSKFFEQKEYDEGLDKHFNNCFYWPTASWKLSGYETLKSQGVALVQSEELRSTIIDLYEIQYNELAEIIRTTEGYSAASTVLVHANLEYQLGYSNKIPLNIGAAKPIHTEALKNNTEFYGLMTFWRVLRLEGIRIRKKTITYCEDLIVQIDDHLKKQIQ